MSDLVGSGLHDFHVEPVSYSNMVSVGACSTALLAIQSFVLPDVAKASVTKEELGVLLASFPTSFMTLSMSSAGRRGESMAASSRKQSWCVRARTLRQTFEMIRPIHSILSFTL